MENLYQYAPAMIVVIALVFGIVWAISPKAAKKAAIKTVMFVVAVAIVAILLAIPGLVRAEEWQYATVNGSVDVSIEGEPLYLVVYTTDDGYVLSYFDDCEIVKGTRIRVIISAYGETLDAKVEDPEPIWFPSFLLVGLVAPVEKKFKRVQKMPPDFYLPCSLFDKNTYVVYFTNGKKCFVKVELSEAFEYVRRAEGKGVAAFICTFVEEYKQQAVVVCNYCDFLEYWRGTAISDKINDAYKALTVGVITNNVEPKLDVDEVMVIPEAETKSVIKDKDDPFKQIVEVKYSDNDDKTFTFRCRQAHTPGDYVCVFTKRADETHKTYKNVKVVKYTVMKESEVKALAKSLGYSDITEVYCDKAVDIPEAWSNWRDPADDPELYAPSAEEIADFEAMRETMLGSGYRDF